MDRTGSVGPGHGLIGSAPPLRNPLAAAAEEEDLDPSARRRQQQLQAQQDALALRDERMPPAPSSAGPSSRLTLGAPRMRKAPGSSSSSSTTSFVSSDAAVRATDSDALISRLSALDAGYLDPDPFASLFLLPVDAPGAAHTKALTTRRPPVLNIGTYLRCSALDRVISTLLKQSGQVEDGAGLHIISIGAGSDSRFWRLQSDPALRGRLAHYTELDFKEITKAKIHSIQRSNILQDVIMSSNQGSSTGPSIEVEAGVLKSRRYSLFPCDLRTLAQEKKAPTATDNEGSTETATAEQIRAHIRTMSKGKQRQCDNVDDAMGVDQNNTEGQGVDWRPNEAIGRCPRRRPKTLILAECVLAYLEPRDADALLSWFATLAAPSLEDDGRATREGSDVMVLSFDMCVEGSGRGDREGGGRFGRMMLQNIESRGLPLHGARAYSTPSAHTRRFDRILSAVGTEQPPSSTARQNASLRVRTGAKTMTQLWIELSGAEKSRISRLERLDEVEELEMLMDHYCISWGILAQEPAPDSSSIAKAGEAL